MNKSPYDYVKTWRISTKKRIIESLGGVCQICGYNKSSSALDLHHLDPVKKKNIIGYYLAHPMAWADIIVEVRKCILLCANCHRELHSGDAKLPEHYKTFDESFTDYKGTERERKLQEMEHKKTTCPICGKLKYNWLITCSRKCAAKKKNKIDWDSIDLASLLKVEPVYKVAYKIGISDGGLRKYIRRHKPELLSLTKHYKTNVSQLIK